jgi:hypothetical protein
VEAFLHGPQQQAELSVGGSLPGARKWAKQHCNWREHQPAVGGCFLASNGTYSARRAEPGGRGSAAFCVLTKTRCWYDSQFSRERRAELQEELEKVQQLRIVEQ